MYPKYNFWHINIITTLLGEQMITEEIVLKVVKNYRKDEVVILEDDEVEFFIFKTKHNFICIRRAGNVVLDKQWFRKTNQSQKFRLKDFLGGMYIEEVKKEIKRGAFKICDLNEIFNF